MKPPGLTNEQRAFVVDSGQSYINVWVHDYEIISRDKLLDAREVDICKSLLSSDHVSHVVCQVWRHLNPGSDQCSLWTVNMRKIPEKPRSETYHILNS